MGDYTGGYYRVIKGDTRSLDYSSCSGTFNLKAPCRPCRLGNQNSTKLTRLWVAVKEGK